MPQKAGYILARPSDIRKLGKAIFRGTEIVWEDMDFWTDLLSTECQQFIDWDIVHTEAGVSNQVVRTIGDVDQAETAVKELLPIYDLLLRHTYMLRMFSPSFMQDAKRIKQ